MTTPEPLELDVRPELARGTEPFGLIMATVDRLAPGQALRLIAPFRPVPLFTVMANRGFGCADRPCEDGGWQVTFTPLAPEPEPGLAPGSAPGAMFWPEPARVLDLAGQAMPDRVVLAALAAMAPGEVLFALLDRAPMDLLAELARRGDEWAGNYAADGSAYRLMVRAGMRDA